MTVRLLGRLANGDVRHHLQALAKTHSRKPDTQVYELTLVCWRHSSSPQGWEGGCFKNLGARLGKCCTEHVLTDVHNFTSFTETQVLYKNPLWLLEFRFTSVHTHIKLNRLCCIVH